MNYIEVKNQFWRLRRSKRITNLQADLYDFLIHESSSRGVGNNWENPFQCPNGTICSAIGISEKSLIDARNVLQQLGLISFEGGLTKKKSPIYFLEEYCNKVSNPVSIRGSIPGGNPVSIPGGNQGYINKEETKQKRETETYSDAIASGAVKNSSAKKKGLGRRKNLENDSTPHWQALVAEWYRFYQSRFTMEPSFTGSAPKDLKAICDNLQRRVEKNRNEQWTQEVAVSYLEKFLSYAYELSWIKDNFLLSNLNRQFDKIITSNGKSDSKKGAGGDNEALARDLAEHYASRAGKG